MAWSRRSLASMASINGAQSSMSFLRAGRRTVTAGGRSGASGARYFFTVRQSWPVSRVISAQVAPASRRARMARRSIHSSVESDMVSVVLRACGCQPSRRRMTLTFNQLVDPAGADLHIRLYIERHVESYAERHIRLYTDAPQPQAQDLANLVHWNIPEAHRHLPWRLSVR